MVGQLWPATECTKVLVHCHRRISVFLLQMEQWLPYIASLSMFSNLNWLICNSDNHFTWFTALFIFVVYRSTNLLGWKKSSEKNAWLMNKFIFLSFWTINYDVVFDIWFVNLFVFTNLKLIRNSNDKNLNRNIWIQKIPFFKMAKSPL